jgi:hypothetical protein
MGKPIMNQDKRPAYAPRCFGLASAFGADEDICGQCRAAVECGPIAKDNLAELSKLVDVSHVGSMHFIAEPKKPEASPVPALPKPNPSAAPIRGYGAATHEEMADINAILAEVGDIPEPDDLPSAAHSDDADAAPEPKKLGAPKTELSSTYRSAEFSAKPLNAPEFSGASSVPAMPKPKPVAETESNGFREYAESGDTKQNAFAEQDAFFDCLFVEYAKPEIEALVERYKELFSDDRPLSLDEVTLVDKIAEELTKRGKPPSERGVTAFDGKTCSRNKIAKFKSNLLQVHDQQWVHYRHPGHLTDNTAWGGIFADIFAPGPFNRDRAKKIAEDKHGMDEKAKCLNLSLSQQRELAVLFGITEKNRRFAARAQELRKARTDKEHLLQIERDAVEVRLWLTEYEARTPRARLDIDEHVMIWRCLAMCEGERNYVAGAMREYEKLTGGVKSRKTFRDKIAKLESILAGSTLVKWRGQ